MKKIWKVIAVVCLSMSIFGCSTNTEVNEKKDDIIQIVDQSGRKVSFDQPAKKIASGYYIATTTIIGLGGADQLVGVEMKANTREIYKQVAPEVLDLPALGNKKMFNVEECAKTEPDVVFLPVSLKSYVDKLEDLDIKVVLLNPETQKGFDEAVNIIAKVCGKEEKAKAYFNYRKKLLNTYVKKADSKDKTVYMAGMDILEAASNDMFQGEIIKQAYGVNAIQNEGQNNWMPINVETLLEANPNYILLENGGLTADDVYNNTALTEVNAVKDKQVYVFPASLETWDTPNLSYCLGTLWTYSVLHPDKVSKDDVKKEAKAFYKEFYGIDVDVEALGI